MCRLKRLVNKLDINFNSVLTIKVAISAVTIIPDLRYFAATLVLACASSAGAKDDASPRPLGIELLSDLTFSRVSTKGDGEASQIIDPVTGSSQTQGSAVNLGGYIMVGRVKISGEPGYSVRIGIPAHVRMNSGRGGYADLVDVKTDLSASPKLDIAGNLEFSFGGKVVFSGKQNGRLRGRIPITAEYE
jgi:hypothetical protein